MDGFSGERRARGTAGWQARPDLSGDKSGKGRFEALVLGGRGGLKPDLRLAIASYLS